MNARSTPDGAEYGSRSKTESQVFKTHGATLLEFVKDIDAHILSTVDTGQVPVLDAVEVSRLLKALIVHAPEHSIDHEKTYARMRRGMASGAGYALASVSFAWGRNVGGAR